MRTVDIESSRIKPPVDRDAPANYADD